MQDMGAHHLRVPLVLLMARVLKTSAPRQTMFVALCLRASLPAAAPVPQPSTVSLNRDGPLPLPLAYQLGRPQRLLSAAQQLHLVASLHVTCLPSSMPPMHEGLLLGPQKWGVVGLLSS
jgi:hypothetical protein